MLWFARDIRFTRDLIPLAATVIVSVVANMAYGYVAGLAIHHLGRYFSGENTRYVK